MLMDLRARRGLRAALSASLCLAALSGSVDASADPKPVKPLAVALTGEGKSAYEAGKLLYTDGDAAGALAKFRKAYDVSHDPRLLWNMAACEKSLRHYARAANLVSQYLKDAADMLTAENVASATETQKALRTFTSDVTLSSVPAGARILVDGEPVATAPLTSPLALDVGQRVVRVEASGYEPWETKVAVAGNEQLKVAVALVSRAGARLRVAASEGDAVSVDGRPVGSGAWEGALPAGEHRVRVTADGKRPFETVVQLASGGVRSVDVTLEDEAKKPLVWPWIVGGGLLLGGAAVGGYFLFKPKEEPGQVPTGRLGTVTLPSGVHF